ncbi:MAG: TIGR02266 family protein [Bdellovibrionota bacterium]
MTAQKNLKKKSTSKPSKASNESKSVKSTSKKTEKRSSGNRIPIQLLVDYKCDGHYLFDFCRDLGSGGVFIETESPQNSGSTLDLTFTIPDSKETLKTRGTVIWVQPPVKGREDLVPGMGVQFEKFSSEQRNILEDFVKRYHGNDFGMEPDPKPVAS